MYLTILAVFLLAFGYFYGGEYLDPLHAVPIEGYGGLLRTVAIMLAVADMLYEMHKFYEKLKDWKDQEKEKPSD